MGESLVADYVTCPRSNVVLRDTNLPKHLTRKNNAVYSYIYNSFASECPALSWHCLIYIQLHMKDHYSYVKTKQPIAVPSEPRPRATRFSLPPLACLKVTSLFPRQLLLISSCWQCKFLPCAVRHGHQPGAQRGGAALCLAQLENFLLFSQSSTGQVYLLPINPGHPIHSVTAAPGLSAGSFPGRAWITSSFVFLHVKRHFVIKAALNVYRR